MLDKIIEKITPKKTFYFKSEKYNSLEMFREMLLWLNNLAKTLGGDAFSINYTPLNSSFIFLLLFILSIIIEHIYWINFYREDKTQMFFCILSVPSIGQSFMKIYSFIYHRRKLYKVFSFVDKFHESYFEPSTKKSWKNAFLTRVISAWFFHYY